MYSLELQALFAEVEQDYADLQARKARDRDAEPQEPAGLDGFQLTSTP